MSRVRTQIDIPNRVLARQHGLWTSAYHLIHPADGDDMPSGDSGDELMIYPSPYLDFPSNSANGIPITQDDGYRVADRILSGISFLSDCGLTASCSLPDCSCNPEITPTLPCANCVASVNYTPTELRVTNSSSTFGFQSADINPWRRIVRSIRNNRENYLENLLWNGGCNPTGEDANHHFFTNLSIDSGEANNVNQANINAANGDSSTTVLASLEAELAIAGGGGSAGLIHTNNHVVNAWLNAGLLRFRTVDYGDGIGPREILETKLGGNIIIIHPLGGSLGPEGAAAAAGKYWVFATSMVYLMWNKISLYPEEGNLQSARFRTNDIDVLGAQMLGTFYDPCNVSAALVDMT